MKYFVDSVEVSLEELDRIRKEECIRNLTYLEELQLSKVDLDKEEMHFKFCYWEYQE